MPNVLLVQGTALALPLRDASVHCVVTSPPYYGLRDYMTGTWQGGDPACTHSRRTSTKEASITTESRPTNTNHEQEGWCGGVCGRCGATRVDQQLGLEASPEAYIAAMVQVFREVHRVLHPLGTCWINMGDSYANSGQTGLNSYSATSTLGPQRDGLTPENAAWQRSRPRQTLPPGLPAKNLLGMPWRLAFALQAEGWILRSAITWCKAAPMPESVTDRPTSATEMVFLFAKQPHYFYDATAVRVPYHERTGGQVIGRGIHGSSQARGNDLSCIGGFPQTRSGRNLWNYWVLNPEPLQGFQHYAAFPQALVRRCLLAGAPSRVCAVCQAPWVRHREVVQSWRETAYAGTQAYTTVNRTARVNSGGMSQSVYKESPFAPTCACNAGTQPATILDPFCGSSTTLLVARELGHHAIGVDLSWNYLHDIARERLSLAALHAWQHGQAAQAVSYTDLPLFGGH